MSSMPNKQALIVVDVQNDFMPGGALAVPDGDAVIPVINHLLPCFSTRVFTRDWHPANHLSFAATPGHSEPGWPPHCVQNTPGADFHPALQVEYADKIISKGDRPEVEGYSAFQETDLDRWLKQRGIEELFLTGVATDYCVQATALDARRLGYRVTVLLDAIRAVGQPAGRVESVMQSLKDQGVVLINSGALTCR